MEMSMIQISRLKLISPLAVWASCSIDKAMSALALSKAGGCPLLFTLKIWKLISNEKYCNYFHTFVRINLTLISTIFI